MKPRLWVVGGGIESVPAIAHCQSLGFHVTVSDGDAKAPGMRIADDSVWADIYDVEKNLTLAVKLHADAPFSGVTTLGADVALTVATIANYLGLPGIPLAAAHQCHDKLSQHEYFSSQGILSARYWLVNTEEEIAAILSRHPKLILKPRDNRGARGVLCIDSSVDLHWALNYVLSYSRHQKLLLEECLEGPQLSTETIIEKGRAFTVGISDRNYDKWKTYAPFIVEDGGDLPSVHEPSRLAEINRLMTQIAQGLGIENGNIKGDLVIHKGQLKVIEIALRMSGGYFASHEIPATYDIDMVGMLADMAVGRTVALPQTLSPKHYVCQRYLFLPLGKVDANKLKKIEAEGFSRNIIFSRLDCPADELAKAIENHKSRSGVVIAKGKSRKDAQEKAEMAIKKVLNRLQTNREALVCQ